MGAEDVPYDDSHIARLWHVYSVHGSEPTRIAFQEAYRMIETGTDDPDVDPLPEFGC